MHYFATPYTIHFDDTMAYGSHHFLTGFKFQCAARESLLYGELIFDQPGVPEALDQIHLFTADAYSRNLRPTFLGDRVVILISLEEWGRVSTRFCYRVLGKDGQAICAGFQSMIVADANTGQPIPLPEPLRIAFDAQRRIQEPDDGNLFRDQVLAGVDATEKLFTDDIRRLAMDYLVQRYPAPKVIGPQTPQTPATSVNEEAKETTATDGAAAQTGIQSVAIEQLSGRETPPFYPSYVASPVVAASAQAATTTHDVKPVETPTPPHELQDNPQVWVFPGQGVFRAKLLSQRIARCRSEGLVTDQELDACCGVVTQLIGGDVKALVSQDVAACENAVQQTPHLTQIAIHLQGILGARLQGQTSKPAVLVGHSFGELAALGVAGCYDLETGIRIVCERVNAVGQFGPDDGALLVAMTNRRTVAEEIAVMGLETVIVAGRNHESQTVVSGIRSDLQQLKVRLKTLSMEAIDVPSPTCFHNPQLRSAADAWFRRIRSLPLKSPSLTVYSPIGRRVISAKDDIATILCSQFLRPFDLQGAIEDLASAGFQHFVDCGTTGSLQRLIQSAGPSSLTVTTVENLPNPIAQPTSPPAARQPMTPQPVTQPATPAVTQAVTPTVTPTATQTVTPTVTQAVTKTATLSANPSVGAARLAAIPSAASPRDVTATVATVPASRPVPSPSHRPRPASTTATRRPAIAMVAKGCILPGGATSPEELLRTIIEGRSGIYDQRDFDEQWHEDFYSAELTPDRSTSALAGRVREEDIRVPHNVDPDVFDGFTRAQKLFCQAIMPCAELIGPSQRVICLIGATADGYQDQDTFSALRYAGLDTTDMRLAARIGNPPSATHTPYSAIRAVLDAVIRPGLELTLVDAACASSLYAVALGMQALETYSADIVLAGGVYCPGPGNNCLFSQFRGLTSTGCRPFDLHADGVVFAEGSAVIAMRRLVDAERLELPVHAIVRGAGLSSDGKSSSANVPQTRGQIHALRRCYANYGIDPRSVVAIEGHGTSTPVGDSTEVETLQQFFAEYVDQPIPLHSLKGAVGHTGWAAGTASLIAASEMLRTRRFPGQAFHRQPSKSLVAAADVLQVPTQPIELPLGLARIAVDGFGFGGSNAHVVLEANTAEPSAIDASDQSESATTDSLDDELVLVAYSQILPDSVHPRTGKRCFDRQQSHLPPDVLILPDLADDMDLTQELAVSLVGQSLSQLGDFPNELREQISIVLSHEGKTERAVEASTRVLKTRLGRALAGTPAGDQMRSATEQARPSGPYTLQCMMPNVAAGRAALQYNLNGPNFAVDADLRSIEAAFASAQLLLHSGEQSGTQLVIIAAINANRWPIPHSNASQMTREYAGAFALTTRKYATRWNLNVVCPWRSVRELASHDGDVATLLGETTDQKLDHCFRAIDEICQRPEGCAVDEFPIHVPVWTNAPLESGRDVKHQRERWLLLSDASEADCRELLAALPQHCLDFHLLLVGPQAQQISDALMHQKVSCLTNLDDNTVDSARLQIAKFAPDALIAFQPIHHWDLKQSMDASAENHLGEALFVCMQSLVGPIRSGQAAVWSVIPGGWNGQIHPRTGSLSGLIKATKREIPNASMGVLALRTKNVDTAFTRLRAERSATHNREQDIVYDEDTRLVRRLRVRSAGGAEPLPPVRLNSDSVVIASGGARGVTALMVEALLEDYGCTVIALGRSQLEHGPENFSTPEAEQKFYADFVRDHPGVAPAEMKRQFTSKQARWEADRTLRDLQALGGQVRYYAIDVTNPDEVDGVIDQVTSTFGRVDLIMHGAGVQWSKKLEDRTLQDFRKTFAVKVHGLKNLVNSCQRHTGYLVPAHVLTSAYSIFGNDGQHDYGAANETLDRLCQLTENLSGPKWTSIAWSAWNAIGMTRGSEYKALAASRNLALIGATGGKYVFRQVITGKTHSHINVPLSESERSRYVVKTLPPVSGPVQSTIEMPIHLSGVGCLPYHKARDVETLPGAWIVDFMVQATLRLQQRRPSYVQIEQMKFLRFLRITPGLDQNIRIVVDETEGGYHASLVGNVLNPSGIVLVSDVVFAKAKLSTIDHDLGTPSLNGLVDSCEGRPHCVKDPYCAGHPSVNLSGPFNCLQDIEIRSNGRRARFQPTPMKGWHGAVPAMLLDASLRVAGMHLVPNALHVPTRIDRVILPVGFSVDSESAAGWRIRTSSPMVQKQKHIRCDLVEVTDSNGNLKLSVEGALVTEIN